ncbi:Protein ALWAYS EARLY 2 [Acorus gramineus]|uniref:Protein ALWAYS EARLY 2 n=1 Tax=Acorus gramineus TaxID=55184 RepID=A0AAV9BQS0_ACOGR|nr:Protein ALWAYS EARLY 2 [Acorus gramineus]
MRLTCTALERVPLTRAKIIEQLMKKFHQDLVFCRSPGDNDLTTGVLESSVQVKEEKKNVDDAEKPTVPGPISFRSRRDRSKALGKKITEYPSIAGIITSNNAKIGEVVIAWSSDRVLELIDQISLRAETNGDSAASHKNEASEDSKKCSSKSKRLNQIIPPMKQGKSIRVPEQSSSRIDLEKATTEIADSTAQVPVKNQVNLPTQYRSRRKRDLQKALSSKDIKLSQNIVNVHPNKYLHQVLDQGALLKGEREKLEKYRESVRSHYTELRSGIRDGLPTDLARPLAVGQRVIACHPKPRKIRDGSVLTVDRNRCWVQFDRADLGVEFVLDIDCMPLNPLENIPRVLRRQNVIVDKFFNRFNETRPIGWSKEMRTGPIGKPMGEILEVADISQYIASTTASLSALMSQAKAASRIIESGGLISVMVYIGHPGGREELETVQAFASHLPTDTWTSCRLETLNHPTALLLILIFKKGKQ